ncbi:MAG: YcaQ family DNA glycosylase [Myxococcaceae bacterium]|nr:YcaQ family DNA glycosylase [Myxococcaceae bacterium]
MADLDALRRYAVSRTLFTPTTLPRALDKLGFVQADPIRAPARAQDLVLRHRVKGYRAGDLERRYAALKVDESFFINYGFLPRRVYALMHPRLRLRDVKAKGSGRLSPRSLSVLEFVTKKMTAHPREVDAHFAHGTVTNWWGGQSSATTQALDELHYRGHLRVARRDAGIRVYAPVVHGEHTLTAAERVDALIDVAVGLYAPLPLASLSYTLGRLRYAVPHLLPEVRAGLQRARARLASHDGWFWPADEEPDGEVDDTVRLLAPFDPIVWDRRRFELLWGWPYRFEAYTPAAKRRYGYYALPVLYRERIVGWANATREKVELGFVSRTKPPKRAIDAELERLHTFLGKDT